MDGREGRKTKTTACSGTHTMPLSLFVRAFVFAEEARQGKANERTGREGMMR